MAMCLEAVESYSPRAVKHILMRATANAAYRQQRDFWVATGWMI